MTRERNIRRVITALPLPAGADPLALECAFGEALVEAVPRALGVPVLPRLEILSSLQGGCLLLPAEGEVFIAAPTGARSLRGDEMPAYEAAIQSVATALGLGPPRYRIEHIVALAWDDFGPDTWSAFDAACAAIPSWAGRHAGMARWFGADTPIGPCLAGSVEPPGFHLMGVLPAAVFDAWRAAFLDACDALPFRT